MRVLRHERARIHLPEWTHEVPNPLDREDLDDWVRRLDEAAGPHHAVALTGGEPLLFVEFLCPLVRKWRAGGSRILLETGGHRPRELAEIIEDVDIVMADVKIESTAGFATDPAIAKAFIEIAATRECAVKVVVSGETTTDEVAAVAELVADRIPLILQPVTGSKFDPPTGDRCLELQRAAMPLHRDTRVIPQTHRALHVR